MLLVVSNYLQSCTELLALFTVS